jgi:hypothetical protein
MPKKDMEVRIVKLEDGQGAIMGQLTKMDETLVGMDHVIRGNGGPGLTTKFETHDQRIRELEKVRKSWKDFMVLIMSGGLVALIAEILHHVVGK